jgi:hypothetical protein
MVVAGRHLLYCLSIFERFYYFAVPGFRINKMGESWYDLFRGY